MPRNEIYSPRYVKNPQSSPELQTQGCREVHATIGAAEPDHIKSPSSSMSLIKSRWPGCRASFCGTAPIFLTPQPSQRIPTADRVPLHAAHVSGPPCCESTWASLEAVEMFSPQSIPQQGVPSTLCRASSFGFPSLLVPTSSFDVPQLSGWRRHQPWSLSTLQPYGSSSHPCFPVSFPG